jgi:hypothetical protein
MIEASKQDFKRTEMDAEKSARFAILERKVLSAERGGYLSNEEYRAIAELEGHGERPEVDALLERAQSVRERDGLFFRDMEGTIAALENGQLSLPIHEISALSIQVDCYHCICENRMSTADDSGKHEQALELVKDLRSRTNSLVEAAIARERDKDRAKVAKLEQVVLDSENRGTVLSNSEFISISGRVGNGDKPEANALLERAQAVRERDGLFFRDLEGTIVALEKGQLSLSIPQMLALSVQANCNYHIVHDCTKLGYGRNAEEEYQGTISKAKSLDARASRLCSVLCNEEMERQRARENERDHEGDLSSPRS